jgi:hypothetical protein
VLPNAVGYVFFRAVLEWRRPIAVLAALALVPVAIYASIAWSIVFMDLFLR